MLRKTRPAILALTLLLAPAHAETLDQFFQREWEYKLIQEPIQASILGDRRYNSRWPDLSLSTFQEEYRHNQAVLKQLKTFKRTPKNQLNYDLFEQEYTLEVEAFQYGWYRVPLTQRSGIQTRDQLINILPFNTIKDYEDWLSRLNTFPRYMDQTISLMQEGIRTKTLLPKVIMARVPKQIDQQIVTSPEQSPFYRPFLKFPDTVPISEQTRLKTAAQTAINNHIIPSYRTFKQFFNEQYLPASFEQVGIWQIPKGDKLYALYARKYTTTQRTPAEIHELGLREVKRIRGEMEAIIQQVGFKGSFSEFLEYLRTDPKFYYKTPEELLTAYRALTRRLDPQLLKVFKTLPRMPYAVEPIPAASAPDTTTAYYQQPAADGSRPGIYYVNLYKPEVRPKYEMMALSLHEAVPGHHFQIALAQELGAVPNFRRYGGYTAFIEGWGLYAESLGVDMGLYEDPYDRFGQLTYEMWRAVRLVVDTGMHYYHWDRQRAIDFFLDNAAKQKLDVINEIDRYLVMPGQALAYKVGELKFKELRARAQTTLGSKFDLREFNDQLLSQGAVPLDILERDMERWLKAKAQ